MTSPSRMPAVVGRAVVGNPPHLRRPVRPSSAGTHGELNSEQARAGSSRPERETAPVRGHPPTVRGCAPAPPAPPAPSARATRRGYPECRADPSRSPASRLPLLPQHVILLVFPTRRRPGCRVPGRDSGEPLARAIRPSDARAGGKVAPGRGVLRCSRGPSSYGSPTPPRKRGPYCGSASATSSAACPRSPTATTTNWRPSAR